MKNTSSWDREALLNSPLYEPLYPILSCIEGTGFPALHDLNALLGAKHIATQAGLPLVFVPQGIGKQDFESQYEPRCYLAGEVQTRAQNWHDLLNALVWLTFPKAKAAINARHYRALTQTDEVLTSQRGAVRDMNTLFDESGVIAVCADPELAGLLRNFQWKELFWQRRQRVQQGMGFYLFGHGLYEKALQPYTGLTGQGLLLCVAQEFFAWPLLEQLAYLDERVAAYLSAWEHCLSTRELTPVPLLGVPGWSELNQCASYYDNAAYFRPARWQKIEL